MEYELAKKRDETSKEVTQIRRMKDAEGRVLTEDETIWEPWNTYFDNLLNEESPRTVMEDGIANLGMTKEITPVGAKKAVSKIKNSKAVGPENMPVEARQSLGEAGIEKLSQLVQVIWREKVMPAKWRKSAITPIYKGKGDIQGCGNYRGIKLMSHTMKIRENIIEQRLRKETNSLGVSQDGVQRTPSISYGWLWKNTGRNRKITPSFY